MSGNGPVPRTCFGYGVRSSLSFHYLRAGSGEPLMVSEHDGGNGRRRGDLLMEWTVRLDRPFHAQLYRRGTGFELWTDDLGRFQIDPDHPAIRIPPSHEESRREARLWGIPAAMCFLRRGDLSLHAAAVEVDGTAVLIAAPGRFGKTTMAAAFLAAGHRLLAEDLTCYRPSSPPTVLPGPALLRVRPETFERLTFPGTRVVAQDPDRVHLAVEDGLRGDGSPIPVGAVVLLRPGEGPARVDRVPAPRALPDLWALTLDLPVDGHRARAFQALAHLADSVPVWNLHRPAGFDRLTQSIDMVVSVCISG